MEKHMVQDWGTEDVGVDLALGGVAPAAPEGPMPGLML